MRTRHFQSVIWLPLLALAGCAAPSGSNDVKADAPAPSAAVAKEPAAAASASQPNSTVVISTNYSMDGLILPVVRGQQTVQTRADMRRTDSTLSFDNKFLRAIAGENQSADIVRLDKKLHWMLNTSKKTYRECPLTGCQTNGSSSSDKPKQERPSKESEPSCPLTLKKNELKVVNTGERKTIHAFNTEHIQVKWTMELQDKKKRITSNHVVLDLWTAPEVGVVKQAQNVDETFQKNWLSAVGGTEQLINKYIPSEVLNSMGTLMHSMGGKNANNMAAWGTELKKVRGYPISTTFTWNAEGNACGDSASSDQTGSSAKPASIGDAIGSLMGSKAQDKGKGSTKGGTGRALLTYTHEVKSIEIKPVSDVSFAPETGYRRVQE
jgi:hypothetical protein